MKATTGSARPASTSTRCSVWRRIGSSTSRVYRDVEVWCGDTSVTIVRSTKPPNSAIRRMTTAMLGLDERARATARPATNPPMPIATTDPSESAARMIGTNSANAREICSMRSRFCPPWMLLTSSRHRSQMNARSDDKQTDRAAGIAG